VSVVTYVVAAGLTLVGVFLGALAVSNSPVGETAILPAMQFTYSAVPWLALAALTASAGRLLDELISADGIRTPYLNLPFGVVALGLVVRGFSGYFLQREGVLSNLVFLDRVVLSATQRLALFIVVGIVVSLVGVRVAVTVTDEQLDEVVESGGQEDA
jgi:putative membrane protein